VLVVGTVGGAATIFEQQAFEPAVVGLAHRRMDADVGRDPRQGEIGDAAQPQHQFEIGGAEGALAGLVDDRLAGQGLRTPSEVLCPFFVRCIRFPFKGMLIGLFLILRCSNMNE
jgi:hypothetical protein